MNMSIAFVTNLETSKRVKPRNRTLDWPTRFAKATAMRRADFCEHVLTFCLVLPDRKRCLKN